MAKEVTNCNGNEAREIVARFKHKCDECNVYFYRGERVVIFWDWPAPGQKSGNMFLMHKRCARKHRVVWHEIPRLKWSRVTALRWETRSVHGEKFEILRSRKLKVFGCVKNSVIVFKVARDLVTAQAWCEEEAERKNIEESTKIGLAFMKNVV